MRQHRGEGIAGEQPVDRAVQRKADAPGKSTLVERVYGEAVQLRGAPGGDGAESAARVHTDAEHGVSGAGGGLPHLDRIQRLFGPQHDVSGVQAHTGGKAAEACDAIGASAYATGNHVAFRGAPDLHTAAHEAAHVVQQRAGVQLLGGVGIAGDPYEQHADRVADHVVRGESAAHLLDSGPGGGGGSAAVQRQQPGQQQVTTPATGATGEQAGATGTGAAAAGPTGLCTEFGDFDIYPDSFVGPLPRSDRGATTWPIRRAAFDNLMVRLRAVKAGTSKLVVTGTAQFTGKAYLDLGWLMTSPVGQDLINDITSTSFTVTINEVTGGNVTSYSPDSGSWENTDHTPGAGANATIGYNPVEINPYGGTEPWMTRPPAIGLAHEMVHAWTAVHGTRARGTDAAGTNRRELQATGLGEFQNLQISENRFRAAFGLPLRPRY